MKQNKKIFIGIIAVIAVIALVFMIVCMIFDVSFFDESADDERTEYVKIINETYPADIMLIGGDVGFPDELNTRKLTEITAPELALKEQYMFSVLIINDLDGNVYISDEEWDIIAAAVFDHVNLYYLGQKYLDKIKTYGLYTDDLSDTDMSIGYLHEPDISFPFYGFFTVEAYESYQKNPDLLSQILLYSIQKDVIKDYIKQM